MGSRKKVTYRISRPGQPTRERVGFLHDGELYIAGRAKDLIIIRGRNYAPQEMEELLLDVEGVRKGCTVAVSTMVEGEQLIILAEKDPRSTQAAVRGREVATGVV
jgi:fatty-acyl-CoA synthase